jgi:S-formylglutathione hydrolase FrmB
MILRGHVFSRKLEMETGISVVCPNVFGTGKPYKVAYLLHGLCGRSGDWIDYSMLPVYAQDGDTLFVMPEAARSFYADQKYGQNYFDYIVDELPEICRSLFNISAERERTAIIGASMGGYGALKAALSRPGQYGFACAFSSPCLFLNEYLGARNRAGNAEGLEAELGPQLAQDFRAAFGEPFELSPGNDILGLARGLAGRAPKPSIYAACGKADPFRAENGRFAGEMRSLDFDFSYEEWEGKHDFRFFDEALRRAIAFIGGPGSA